ncbi:MAG: type II toxin-antitoxin system Phd/YefM family antitoxin [Campylobacterales bacterium]
MLSVNEFRANLKTYVDTAISTHEPLKVSRRNGGDFVVMSLEDYERENETLYVLQNSSLMNQIVKSLKTFEDSKGYKPNSSELNEINSI